MVEVYNVKSKGGSYAVEIPLSDHSKILSVIENSIKYHENTIRETQEFIDTLPSYAEQGAITEELAEKLKEDRKYQVEDLKEKNKIAEKIYQSLLSI